MFSKNIAGYQPNLIVGADAHDCIVFHLGGLSSHLCKTKYRALYGNLTVHQTRQQQIADSTEFVGLVRQRYNLSEDWACVLLDRPPPRSGHASLQR